MKIRCAAIAIEWPCSSRLLKGSLKSFRASPDCAKSCYSSISSMNHFISLLKRSVSTISLLSAAVARRAANFSSQDVWTLAFSKCTFRTCGPKAGWLQISTSISKLFLDITTNGYLRYRCGNFVVVTVLSSLQVSPMAARSCVDRCYGRLQKSLVQNRDY